MDIQEFLVWEKRSRDSIDVKRCYIDAAGDLISGILLSQIVYWHLPSQNGHSKLTVEHQGFWWLAKKREDWWDEVRISVKQFDRAIAILESKGFVTTEIMKFNGAPTKHIRLNWQDLLDSLEALPDMDSPKRAISNFPPVGNYPKGKIEITQRGRSKLPKGEDLSISTKNTFKDSLSKKGKNEKQREREGSKNCEIQEENPANQETVPTQFNIEPQGANTLCGNNSLLIKEAKSSAGTRDNSSLWDWVPQGEWKLPETGKLDSKFVDWEVDKWKRGSKYDRPTIFKLVLREWKKEPALLAIAWEAYRMEAQHRVAATMVTVQAQGKMEQCDRAIIDQYLPAAASSSENSPVAASISQNAQSYLSQYQALSTPRLDASSDTEETWTEQEEQENLEKIKKMRADAIAKAKQNSALHTTKRTKSQ